MRGTVQVTFSRAPTGISFERPEISISFLTGKTEKEKCSEVFLHIKTAHLAITILLTMKLKITTT